jgi:hypothetical protein
MQFHSQPPPRCKLSAFYFISLIASFLVGFYVSTASFAALVPDQKLRASQSRALASSSAVADVSAVSPPPVRALSDMSHLMEMQQLRDTRRNYAVTRYAPQLSVYDASKQRIDAMRRARGESPRAAATPAGTPDEQRLDAMRRARGESPRAAATPAGVPGAGTPDRQRPPPPPPMRSQSFAQESQDVSAYLSHTWPDCASNFLASDASPQDKISSAWMAPGCAPVRGQPIVLQTSYHNRILHESPEAYQQRLQDWRVRTLALAANMSDQITLLAYPSQTALLTQVFFRTAYFLEPTRIAMPVFKPFVGADDSYRFRSMVLQAGAIVTRTMEPLSACMCDTSRMGDVVSCRLSSPLGPEAQTLAVYLSLGDGRYFVPIEPLPAAPPRPTAAAPSDAHVCLQGYLYREKVLGQMPQLFVEKFVAFYAKMGVSNIHLYTSDLAHVSDISSVNRSALGSTRLWVHEASFPDYHQYAAGIMGLHKKRQKMAVQDCALRAKAMGAKWILYVDMDEYLFFDEKLPASTTLAEFMDVRYDGMNAVYVYSLLFDTVRCVKHNARNPDSYRDFMNHFALAKVDKTFMGRRKMLLNLDRVSFEQLSEQTSIDTHVVSWAALRPSGINEALAQGVLHLHHYRDGWHARVCTQVHEPNPDVSSVSFLGSSPVEFRLHKQSSEMEWFV